MNTYRAVTWAGNRIEFLAQDDKQAEEQAQKICKDQLREVWRKDQPKFKNHPYQLTLIFANTAIIL